MPPQSEMACPVRGWTNSSDKCKDKCAVVSVPSLDDELFPVVEVSQLTLELEAGTVPSGERHRQGLLASSDPRYR